MFNSRQKKYVSLADNDKTEEKTEGNYKITVLAGIQ